VEHRGDARASGPKERTWRLLREAARELMRTGGPLTVPAAAELAGVSRATAYRYFPNNDAVVLHASMSLADNPLDDAEWAPAPAASPGELGDQAADLVRATASWAFDHETELRTMLRLSLEPEREHEKLRQGRTNRGRWIAALLEGLPSDIPGMPVSGSRRRSSPCLDPTPSCGPRTWPSCHGRRPSTSWHGWRKS